ncbi:MAG: poly(beta-D-mannuronate) lyase [Alteromonadaceae bacterium]|nr:poly(beta-D-mannuronate) lyase [Alteromonadaceae bacterium]
MPVRRLFMLLVTSMAVGCTHVVADSPGSAAHRPANASECPKAVPEPFTGPLIVESKYVQTDQSKSTLKARRSEQSEEVQRRIEGFTKGIVRFADFYLNNVQSRKGLAARACVSVWLEAWAEADALTTDETSKTGVAVRKWALASLSAALWKLKHVEGVRWSLSEAQSLWLEQLADKVIADYGKRLDPEFSYFNNHDYWAAWSVAVTGVVVNRQDYLRWSIPFYQRAMGQVTTFAGGRYGYLPNELARKNLAANYTHYALVPLVLLSDILRKHGYVPSPEEDRKLDQLVSFSAQIILQPRSVREVVTGPQKDVPNYKLAWLIPYLNRHPDHPLAMALFARHNGNVDGYSQAGGKLRPVYGDVTSGSY